MITAYVPRPTVYMMGEPKIMDFQEAFRFMQHGFRVRRKDWEGYWAWENDTIVMHCKDGVAIDIRATDDVAFTISNILANDWVVLD